MSKHTAGPWESSDRYGMVVTKDKKGWEIADIRPDVPEFEANARLMAAAPDLLEALEELKCELILSDVDMDYIESHFRPSLNKAMAAIARAKGDA